MGTLAKPGSLAKRGLRQARESGYLFSVGFALAISAVRSNYRREPGAARVYAEEAMALSEENGFAAWLSIARFNRGWALAELGQVKPGIAEMEAATASFGRLGGQPGQQLYIARLARTYASEGESEKALKMLNSALAHIERTGEQLGYAEMLRFKGEMLMMHDARATEQAESCFRAALNVARAQEAKW